MSFLKNIFGAGSRNLTSMIVHDQFLEVIQLVVVDGSPELVGVNRIELDGGIVQRGEIVRESDFQAALQNLFSGALPNPIRPAHLFITVPYDQLYSFIKVFPSHTSDDHMKMGIKELLMNQSPYEFQEVEVQYSKRSDGKNTICGAFSYPKRWKHRISEACSELGFRDLHCVAESIAQTSYMGPEKEGHFILTSWQEGKIVLSLFLNGLLYDSYMLREQLNEEGDGKFIFDAISQAEHDLKDTFDADVSHLVFASFPHKQREVIRPLAEQTGKKTVYLKEEESALVSLIDLEKYSTSLTGLSNYSLNPEAEKHKM